MSEHSDPFQDVPLEIPDEVIVQIFRQAWALAQAEARQLLKQKMLQTIIDRVRVSGPGLFSLDPEAARPAAAAPVPEQISETEPPRADPAAVGAVEVIRADAQTKPSAPIVPAVEDRALSADAKRIQEEIEAIRQKLGQNEQILQQIKTPPPPPADPEPAARAEPLAAAESDRGYYVYCVEANDSSGLRQPEMLQAGIDPDYPLYTITNQTLRAVVSQVPLQEFGEVPLDRNLHDSAWLESKVRRHQDVLEQISSTATIIPMRFCTIYLSETRVQEMLAQYQVPFSRALENLAGRQEWGVKGYYDTNLLSHYVEETDDSILALKAGGAGKSTGLAYFARKKLTETVVEQVERASDACAQDSHNRLTACAAASSLMQVQTKEAAGRQEEMVFNGAYLLDTEKIGLFRLELEQLGNDYGPRGFSYEFTGPWPPYNFVRMGGEENLDE